LRNALLGLALFAAACRSEAPAPQPAAAAPVARDTTERPNLLNIAYGASVVSRTAEVELEHSALRAIDGESVYGDAKWVTVPHDPKQTLVFGLPAPARIEQLGLTTLPGVFAAGSPAFEVSMDGRQYERVALPPFEAKLDLQLKPVPKPVEARYVRLTLDDGGPFATLSSVQLRGKFTATPSVAPIDGCWMINGLQASFTEVSGDVRGTIGDHTLHGGRDGAVYRFAWRGKTTWGHALITLSPDGSKLSGLKWYEEPIAYNAAESWFGEKCSGGTADAAPESPGDTRGAPLDLFLQRAKRYPIYGNAVETVMHVLRQSSSPKVRLVSREYRGASESENRRIAQERLDGLRSALQKAGADLNRLAFNVAGSEKPHQPIENESMRVLYGAIEIAP
jgi:hypothetical protein